MSGKWKFLINSRKPRTSQFHSNEFFIFPIRQQWSHTYTLSQHDDNVMTTMKFNDTWKSIKIYQKVDEKFRKIIKSGKKIESHHRRSLTSSNENVKNIYIRSKEINLENTWKLAIVDLISRLNEESKKATAAATTKTKEIDLNNTRQRPKPTNQQTQTSASTKKKMLNVDRERWGERRGKRRNRIKNFQCFSALCPISFSSSSRFFQL